MNTWTPPPLTPRWQKPNSESKARAKFCRVELGYGRWLKTLTEIISRSNATSKAYIPSRQADPEFWKPAIPKHPETAWKYRLYQKYRRIIDCPNCDHEMEIMAVYNDDGLIEYQEFFCWLCGLAVPLDWEPPEDWDEVDDEEEDEDYEQPEEFDDVDQSDDPSCGIQLPLFGWPLPPELKR